MENESSSGQNYFLWRQGRLFAQTAKQNIVTWVFNIIGFTLSVGLVLMGYTYGKSASERILATASSKTPPISVFPTQPVVPTIPQQEQSPDCPAGLVLSSLNSFEFCLPNTFTKESNSNTSVRFRSADEEFVVSRGILEKFPIHICHLEKEVLVAESFATRTIFREETATGCGETIGFATTIYSTLEGDIQLHLWKESGTYTDEKWYEKIEQSVRF